MLLILASASGALLQAQSVSRFSEVKTSPRIEYHRSLKALPEADGREGRALRRLRRGLDLSDPELEHVALYVEHPLSSDELQEFEAFGVAVNSWAWVPPVEGHHRYGYYLARVRYDALPALERDRRVVRIQSTESVLRWHNDLAVEAIGAHLVHRGDGLPGRTGEGVRIAIADSGLDLTHPDLPEPVEAFDLTDGFGPSSWDPDVTDLTSGHGTHVAGTAVGSGGLSGGRYRGAAPDAELYFYKAGLDGDPLFLQTEDLIEAFVRAVDVEVDVFSLSAGGLGMHLDGSDPLCQALDAATAAGVTSFVSAGNDGNEGMHCLVEVGPGGTSETIRYTIDNSDEPFEYFFEDTFVVIWRDGPGASALRLENLGFGPAVVSDFSEVSPRGTRSAQFRLFISVPAGQVRTYELALRSTGSCETARAHIYRGFFSLGFFEDATESHLVSSPAVADTAVAVGAWTTRDRWTNFLGEQYSSADLAPDSTLTVGEVSSFSSPGPRIDGLSRPAFVAPGAWLISCRDSVGTALEEFDRDVGRRSPTVIDNDGETLDGTGPANYLVLSGTSMAAPLAAGAACLLLEAHPELGPRELAWILERTVSASVEPGHGQGLLDVAAAVRLADGGLPEECVGPEEGGADCDDSGHADRCEIAVGLLADCDGSGVPDTCELADGTLEDCDENGLADRCEWSADPSLDCDANGRLDVCELVSAETPFVENVLAGRAGPLDLATQDLDQDGILDLIVLHEGGILGMFHGSVSGFSVGPQRTLTGDGKSLALGDVTGDSTPDVLVLSEVGAGETASAEVVIYEGNGELALGEQAIEAHRARRVVELATIDLDHDGTLDVLVLNDDPRTVTVYLVRDGRFTVGKSYPLGARPSGMAFGDVDGDGNLDLVTTTRDGVDFLRGTGTGRFSLPESLELGVGELSAPLLVDLNADSRPDFVCVVQRCDLLAVFENDASGDFALAETYDVGDAPRAVEFHAIDAGGDGDLVVASQRGRSLSLVFDPLSGREPREAVSVPLSGRPEALLAVGGAEETLLVTANRSDDSLSMVARAGGTTQLPDCDGDGRLDRCQESPTGERCPTETLFVRGDANDSGAADISDGVAIFRFLFLGVEDPSCLEAADIDNDGEVLITDGISLLNHLFLGGEPPAEPGLAGCGADPDPPGSFGALGCVEFASCP